MTKGQWIEFTGSDEQIAEMKSSEHGYVLRRPLVDSPIRKGYVDSRDLRETTHYLICNPHPLREMIKRQADTGQEVWVKVQPGVGVYIPPSRYLTTNVRGVFVTTTPDWNIPNAEYSFTPFEEK